MASAIGIGPRGVVSSSPQLAGSRPFGTIWAPRCSRPQPRQRWPRHSPQQLARAADAAGAAGLPDGGADYTKPFPKMNERNVYKRLGVSPDASFPEIIEAKNYLLSLYSWHQDSKESIELAFEACMSQSMKTRKRVGFLPAGVSRRSGLATKPGLLDKAAGLLDATVSPRTLVNEGLVWGGLSLWCLTGADQSFPLAGAFAYSVYAFQRKRTRANPEGPFLGGNPIIGAILTTLVSLCLGIGLMALATGPLARFVPPTIVNNVGSFMVVAAIGTVNVFIK